MADLVPSNIHALLGQGGIVLDATDNFETRYLLNDYALEQGHPGFTQPRWELMRPR